MTARTFKYTILIDLDNGEEGEITFTTGDWDIVADADNFASAHDVTTLADCIYGEDCWGGWHIASKVEVL